MRCLKILLIGLFSLLSACGEQLPQLPHRALPFPTPAQHDLIVLISNGPLTYYADDKGAILGIEHDLVEAFAQELGVGVKYLVVVTAGNRTLTAGRQGAPRCRLATTSH